MELPLLLHSIVFSLFGCPKADQTEGWLSRFDRSGLVAGFGASQPVRQAGG
jgi:hypothetical protein